MNKTFFFNKFLPALTLLLIFSISVFAQNVVSPNPSQEKLLNGLKILKWNAPQTETVSVKIRIHCGSAFDPQGKEGLMSLLKENLFPNSIAKEAFSEDLGGSLEVVNNYDYIQINATGKSEEFLTILQTLATAVSNMTIDKETTAKLKAAQIEKIKELEKNPAYIADQAAAQRLFGTFPYGRPVEGTAESIQKIDFADLISFKERFLTADNATVAIIGNVKSDFAFRAAKRYFGSWLKSDSRVPSAFRQPDEPDTKPFSLTATEGKNSEIRYALRGLARNDKDFPASEILTKILSQRLQNLAIKESANNVSVRHEEHILPGLLILGYSSAAAPVSENPVAVLFSQNISADEFAKAKTEVLNDRKSKDVADLWFDTDTFKIVSATDEAKSFENLTLADAQRVAERLSKNPVVRVSVIQAKAGGEKN